MQLESNLLLESHDPKPMGGVDILEDLIVSQVRCLCPVDSEFLPTSSCKLAREK
uniref:Uncharacterized protein n=1 Tax=Setaria viridis TaxID=4556 RepID=A0A4U6U6Y5_SETVI|nr:hypothetical protein SEVIR_6G149300v2 [Setaria viridis]